MDNIEICGENLNGFVENYELLTKSNMEITVSNMNENKN